MRKYRICHEQQNIKNLWFIAPVIMNKCLLKQMCFAEVQSHRNEKDVLHFYLCFLPQISSFSFLRPTSFLKNPPLFPLHFLFSFHVTFSSNNLHSTYPASSFFVFSSPSQKQEFRCSGNTVDFIMAVGYLFQNLAV